MKIYTYDNKVMTVGGKWMEQPELDPYNPLNLPPFTLRVEFYGTDASFDPTQYVWDAGTWTAAGGSAWDWTYQNTVWSGGTGSILRYFYPATQTYRVLSAYMHCNILGGNTTGVTNMSLLFTSNRYIESIALFDTSSVVDFSYFCSGHSRGSILSAIPLFNTSSAVNARNMFEGCTSLQSIPLFDTSSMTDVRYMFRNCRNVESGALALYNQMSTQATPPSTHDNTFLNCGRSTVTGAAELAQIPTSWGGTMSDDNPGEIG